MKGILEPVINSNKIIMTAQIVMQAENQQQELASPEMLHHFIIITTKEKNGIYDDKSGIAQPIPQLSQKKQLYKLEEGFGTKNLFRK